MNRTPSHSVCTAAHTLSAYHVALFPCTTSLAQGQPDCVPKTVVSFHLSRAMSLAPNRTPSTSSSTFLPLFQVSKGCSHQEIPVTDILIQNLSQNKQEEMAKVHIIDHRANTAENFAMRRRTAGTPRAINLRLVLARAGLMTETKATTNDNQAQQY